MKLFKLFIFTFLFAQLTSGYTAPTHKSLSEVSSKVIHDQTIKGMERMPLKDAKADSSPYMSAFNALGKFGLSINPITGEDHYEETLASVSATPISAPTFSLHLIHSDGNMDNEQLPSRVGDHWYLDIPQIIISVDTSSKEDSIYTAILPNHQQIVFHHDPETGGFAAVTDKMNNIDYKVQDVSSGNTTGLGNLATKIEIILKDGTIYLFNAINDQRKYKQKELIYLSHIISPNGHALTFHYKTIMATSNTVVLDKIYADKDVQDPLLSIDYKNLTLSNNGAYIYKNIAIHTKNIYGSLQNTLKLSFSALESEEVAPSFVVSKIELPDSSKLQFSYIPKHFNDPYFSPHTYYDYSIHYPSGVKLTVNHEGDSEANDITHADWTYVNDEGMVFNRYHPPVSGITYTNENGSKGMRFSRTDGDTGYTWYGANIICSKANYDNLIKDQDYSIGCGLEYLSDWGVVANYNNTLTVSAISSGSNTTNAQFYMKSGYNFLNQSTGQEMGYMDSGEPHVLMRSTPTYSDLHGAKTYDDLGINYGKPLSNVASTYDFKGEALINSNLTRYDNKGRVTHESSLYGLNTDYTYQALKDKYGKAVLDTPIKTVKTYPNTTSGDTKLSSDTPEQELITYNDTTAIYSNYNPLSVVLEPMVISSGKTTSVDQKNISTSANTFYTENTSGDLDLLGLPKSSQVQNIDLSDKDRLEYGQKIATGLKVVDFTYPIYVNNLQQPSATVAVKAVEEDTTVQGLSNDAVCTVNGKSLQCAPDNIVTKKFVSYYTGQTLATMSADQAETIYQYDLKGRVIKTISNATHKEKPNAKPLVTLYKYDDTPINGLRDIIVTDPIGNKTKKVMDQFDNVVGVYSLPNGNSGWIAQETSQYDSYNQLESKTDYAYLKTDRTKESDAIKRSTKYGYNNAEQLLWVSHADGTADQTVTVYPNNHTIAKFAIKLKSDGQKNGNINSLCHDINGNTTGCHVESIAINVQDLEKKQTDNYIFMGDAYAKYYSSITDRYETYPSNPDLEEIIQSISETFSNGTAQNSDWLSDKSLEFIKGNSWYTSFLSESAQHTQTVSDVWGRVLYQKDFIHHLETDYQYNIKNKVTAEQLYDTSNLSLNGKKLIKTIAYQYDGNGNVINKSIITPENKTLDIQDMRVSNLGFMLSSSIDANEPTTYIYDIEQDPSFGSLTTKMNPDGTQVAYTYNDNGQVSEVSAGKDDVIYQYDDFGRTTDEKNGILDRAYTYDPQSRIETVSEIETKEANTYKTYTYKYLNSMGPIQSVSYYSPTDLEKVDKTYAYQPTSGFLSSVTIASGFFTRPASLSKTNTYQYDTTGHLLEVDKGDPNKNGYKVKLGYNTLDQLISVADTASGLGNGSYTYQYDYGYDGRIARKVSTTSGVKNEYYQYTNLGQLQIYQCSASPDNGLCPIEETGHHIKRQDYRYDAQNNILSLAESFHDLTGTDVDTYKYDTNHPSEKISSTHTLLPLFNNTYHYKNGAMDLEKHQDGSTIEYQYNALGRLQSYKRTGDKAQQVKFEYDPEGKVSEQTYPLSHQVLHNFYSSGKLFEEKLIGTNSGVLTQVQPEERFYVENGEIYLPTVGASKGRAIWQNMVSDGHNLVGLYQDEDSLTKGTLKNSQSYSPFGFVKVNMSREEKAQGENAQLSLAKSVLGYNEVANIRGISNTQHLGQGVRLYNASSRGFINSDPTMMDGNAFNYATNDPVNGFDPSGYGDESEIRGNDQHPLLAGGGVYAGQAGKVAAVGLGILTVFGMGAGFYALATEEIVVDAGVLGDAEEGVNSVGESVVESDHVSDGGGTEYFDARGTFAGDQSESIAGESGDGQWGLDGEQLEHVQRGLIRGATTAEPKAPGSVFTHEDLAEAVKYLAKSDNPVMKRTLQYQDYGLKWYSHEFEAKWDWAYLDANIETVEREGEDSVIEKVSLSMRNKPRTGRTDMIAQYAVSKVDENDVMALSSEWWRGAFGDKVGTLDLNPAFSRVGEAMGNTTGDDSITLAKAIKGVLWGKNNSRGVIQVTASYSYEDGYGRLLIDARSV